MRGSKKRTMQLLRSTMGEVCKMNEARRKEHEVKYVGFHRCVAGLPATLRPSRQWQENSRYDQES